MADAVLNAPPGFVWVRRLASWRCTKNGELAVQVECSDGSLLAVHWRTPVQRILHFQVHPAWGMEGALQGPDFTGLEGSFELEIGK